MVDTEQQKADANCPTEYVKEKLVQNTNTNTMQVTIFYGPETPKIGCDLEFNIQFKKSYSSDIWENQIHYDILRVDSELVPIASAAEDEGRDKFFSTSGQVNRFWLMQGEPGLQNFALIVYGTGPQYVVPNPEFFGYIVFDIDTFGGRVDAATQIKDIILDSKINTIAFINKRAISAGALISLSCDSIFILATLNPARNITTIQKATKVPKMLPLPPKI